MIAPLIDYWASTRAERNAWHQARQVRALAEIDEANAWHTARQIEAFAEIERRREAIRGRTWKCGPWRWAT